MQKRELVYEIKEIKSKYNHSMPNNKEDFVFITTGTISIDGDKVFVTVDDNKQPHGMFIANDNLFKRIIKKIHEATK